MILPILPFRGCKWDSTNYSCAYDVFFTAFVSIYFLQNPGWRQAFSTEGPFSAILAECLQRLEGQVATSDADTSAALYSLARDELRDMVSEYWPESFTRHGHVFASADLLFEKLRRDRPLLRAQATFSCDSCGQSSLASDAFGSYLSEVSWVRHANALGLNENAQTASIDTWVRIMMSNRPPAHQCPCGASRELWSAIGPNMLSTVPPLWLSFNCQDHYTHASPLPSHSLLIPHTSGLLHARYQLKSLVYLGSGHYTSRLFLGDGTVWKYDGRISNGEPVFEMLLLPGAEFPRHRFASLDNRRLTDVLYARIVDGTSTWSRPQSVTNHLSSAEEWNGLSGGPGSVPQ